VSEQTKQIENTKPAHEMTFIEMVAEAAGVSWEYARKILRSKRKPNTEKGERVLVAATILKSESNKLLEEVKRTVSF
jgi:hypothetical protein